MPDKKFDLGEYVEVKDRIKLFYELFGQGRLTTTYELTSEPDGKARVIARALAYRSPDDPIPAAGTSWLELPGSTPYTKGSEIENAETSAIGRAIGFLGILIDKSIASANEIEGKRSEPNPRVGAADYEPPTPPTFEGTPDGGMIGIAEAGKADADFEIRQTPDDGWALAFRLVSGRKSFKVIAEDDLAMQITERRPDIEGQTITAWGRVSEETFQPEGTRKKIPYTVLYLSRLTAGDLKLPAVTAAGTTELENAAAAAAPSGPEPQNPSGPTR